MNMSPGLALVTLLAAGAAAAQPVAPTSPAAATSQLSADEAAALDSIRASRIQPMIRFLASPALEGRESGQRGAEVAAEYLVSRFQAAGLEAGGKEGFLQPFDLRYRVLAKDVEMTTTRTDGASKRSRTWQVRRDFMPLSFSEEGVAEAPIVFAGYGIVAPGENWDDYAALGPSGARGKIVLIFRHEPDELGQSQPSRFDGSEMTLHAALREKIRVAASHGAAGVILVDDPVEHEVHENPSSGGWRTLTDEERAKPADDPVHFEGRADTRDAASPVGLVAVHASQEILRWLDPDRDWKALQRDLDAGKVVSRPAFPGVTARLLHRAEAKFRPTANVVAMLRGSDPELSKEFVLVGGHYDHLGKDEKTEEIHYGADDNASGTAAVIVVAEAFARLPKRPARSMLFACWSGEEKGLLGSDWFVHHPAVDLEKLVAAVNLDMVGRNEEKEMSVVGRTETPDLVELFDRFAPEVGFDLNDDAGAGASRSDNASLWLAGVPTASLFSGTHDDYHEPGDTAGKVVPGKVEKAARLTFLVLNEIASGRMTPKPLSVPAGPWKPVAPASRLVAKATGGAK